ncbi:putative LysE/RhtB family amino acid efflux pump [Candidatus Vecturithrix granuli]|uniref:Putative LysE/RhtB family amino acid efflux pump n=1 Tax=Vecturithrix granuli TaxID=1499967 RepID=A0A081BZS1_VECG1|nr:putative LysE/RhtB family amino acid efflux pump [Candidatus Vecturithrix granuli]
MEMPLFLKGFTIGIAIAAPVGPIGVLCIQRTLTRGAFHGLISGLGAATADALYGFIAAFGLTVISDMILTYQFWFRLIGGLFLCYLGIKAFLATPAPEAATEKKLGHLEAYGTTLLLTITNPMTILAFAAIFSGVGLFGDSLHYVPASLVVLGVFTGSGVWWCILSGCTDIFRKKFSLQKLGWVNKVSGIIIFTFGVFALVSVIQ